MPRTESTLKRLDGLDVHKTEDGYAIYDTRTQKVHFLNHTAAFLFELCDGKHTIAESLDIFKQYFNCTENISEIVFDLIDKFKDERIIE